MGRKRRRGGGHEGGHHGGSWKVAYADFVTAMMAFFLLMWLVNSVTVEKKVQIAGYFKDFSIFEKGGAWDTSSSQGPTAGVTMKIAEVEPSSGGLPAPPGKEDAATQQLEDRLRREIEAKLGNIKDQVLVDSFDGGVRIQVVDKQGHSLFPVGGAQMSSEGRKALEVVSENVRDLGNRLAVEGHTDALSYSTNRFTNWELSTERASAARKVLEQNGINPDCLTRVAGYAATQPLVKDNPYDPRNRRISILVFSKVPCQGAPGETRGEGAPGLAPPTMPPTTGPIRREPSLPPATLPPFSLPSTPRP